MLNNRVLKNIQARRGNSNCQIDYVVLKYIVKKSSRAKKDYMVKKRRRLVNIMLKQYSRMNSIPASKNLCIITGKARSVYRFCRLSRMTLKRYSGLGLLNGLKPSSW